MLTDTPSTQLTPQDVYAAAMNEWLEHNGNAPLLVDSPWAAHEVGLAALVSASKEEALIDLKDDLSKTVGPVTCDADEKGTFIEGMVRMREYVEAELDARAAGFRAEVIPPGHQ